MKIFDNIMSNPSKLKKYGTINLKRIGHLLSNCDPALQLLFIVGFTIKNLEDQERLVWNNTSSNMQIMKDVYSILSLDTDLLEEVIYKLKNGYTYKEAIFGLHYRWPRPLDDLHPVPYS